MEKWCKRKQIDSYQDQINNLIKWTMQEGEIRMILENRIKKLEELLTDAQVIKTKETVQFVKQRKLSEEDLKAVESFIFSFYEDGKIAYNLYADFKKKLRERLG